MLGGVEPGGWPRPLNPRPYAWTLQVDEYAVAELLSDLEPRVRRRREAYRRNGDSDAAQQPFLVR